MALEDLLYFWIAVPCIEVVETLSEIETGEEIRIDVRIGPGQDLGHRIVTL
jgi:hypothetical protein